MTILTSMASIPTDCVQGCTWPRCSKCPCRAVSTRTIRSRTDPDCNHKHTGGFVSPGSLLSNRPLRLLPSRPFSCRPVPEGSHCPGESACDTLASNRDLEASVVAAWVDRALLAALVRQKSLYTYLSTRRKSSVDCLSTGHPQGAVRR